MKTKKVTSGKVTGIQLTPTYYYNPSVNAKAFLIAVLLLPILLRMGWYLVTGL